ncbi:LacI family DNA-binding transcriptional regulator [Devosia sp.]|uniref:LacI family DNA-binding transcriptional regulator n=1 Tax=Devosia sp. TaxID=1871048 RepID=UPI00344B63E7
MARVAGVGTSTVTRVVQGQGYVAAPTRAAVFAAIEQTGYQVNSVARSLSSAVSSSGTCCDRQFPIHFI